MFQSKFVVSSHNYYRCTCLSHIDNFLIFRHRPDVYSEPGSHVLLPSIATVGDPLLRHDNNAGTQHPVRQHRDDHHGNNRRKYHGAAQEEDAGVVCCVFCALPIGSTSYHTGKMYNLVDFPRVSCFLNMCLWKRC